jgi:hypothetical protein
MPGGAQARSVVTVFWDSRLEEETMSRAIKRALTLVTVAAAVAAISAPAASARFELNSSDLNRPAQVTAPSPGTASSSPASTSTSSSSGGFDWGDAGIGAGVALVLVALAGGAVLIGRRGQARSRPATTS